MTDPRVLAGAKAMHARFEQRAERKNPFYTRQGWGAIRDKDRQEFIDWAECVLKGAAS